MTARPAGVRITGPHDAALGPSLNAVADPGRPVSIDADAIRTLAARCNARTPRPARQVRGLIGADVLVDGHPVPRVDWWGVTTRKVPATASASTAADCTDGGGPQLVVAPAAPRPDPLSDRCRSYNAGGLGMSAVDHAGRRSTAGQHTREPVRRPGRWNTPAVRADIVRRYVQGRQSMRQIAAALGCVYSTVNRVLTEAGVEKRSRGGRSEAGQATAPASAAPQTARRRRARPRAALPAGRRAAAVDRDTV